MQTRFRSAPNATVLVHHLPISYTCLLARISFYCVVFGWRATASPPSAYYVLVACYAVGSRSEAPSQDSFCCS